ncbi:MAG: TonB-dependent receptor, partial [Sedimentisphaerales bacterium]|nr:TonB-dependent receptor [Sedimentisphaerales bacterium]
ELMEIEIDVPATITERDPRKTPASVTVITAEEIFRTPARNLMDLLEIYVPGAIYMNHSVGPSPGIRGILVDRPYKFLVNINGINVNIKSHYGARLELLNWDLNDIARIEIVRGPGSVTYGPGAIGGVINIYTKNAQKASGINLGVTYWTRYDSIGNYVSLGHRSRDVELYGYFSLVDTEGIRPVLYGVDSSTSGYVGSNGGPYDPNPPFTYMADFYDEPQIKAHIDMRFKKNWQIWARYVSSSSALTQGSATKYELDGKWQDLRQTRYRYFQFALENLAPLSDEFELKSLFGFSSIDVHNVEKYSSSIINDKDNLQNIGWIWSENEYFTRFMLNYKPESERIKAAAGLEFSYDTVGPAWGKDEDEGLRLADSIISGPSSDAFGSGYRQVDETNERYFPVGKGWETYSHAFLGEINVKLTPKLTTLLSARLDKHSYTDYMFSPRAAWIYEAGKDNYIKFIAQRSVRRNTQEELYMNHELEEDNDPEKLDTMELIYSGKLNDALSFQTSAFFNRNEVIAWDWGQRRSATIGLLKTIGLEVETDYKKENFNLGINHSYIKQIDWNLDDDISVSGISYSDYYQDAGNDVIITSQGDDLNNWPSQATKLFTNVDFFDGKLTLHADLKTLWGFEGREDGLDALENAGGDKAAIDDIRDKGAYDPEITANISLTYYINTSSDLTLFVQNISVWGDNKRYSYSSGFKKSYPDKVSWIEEPAVFGIRYHLKF